MNAPHGLDFFVLSQEPCFDGAVWEHQQEPNPDHDGQSSIHDQQKLPARRLLRRAGVRDTKGQEARDDLGKPITLEGPANALTTFGARIEHGCDQHDTIRDASFRSSQQEAQNDYRI